MKEASNKKGKSQWWLNFRSALPGKLKSIPGRAGRWSRENFRIEGGMAGQLMKNGLITQNPTLVLLLGMCATLAVTTSLENAVGMGLSTTAVLVCANLAISLLRNWIPKEVRIACYVVITAGFVTIIDLLLQAYLPALSSSLGLFIPLIVVNCLILARAEAFASKSTPIYSILDGIAMGLGFTMSLSILGIIREILGKGSIWGISLFGPDFQPMLLVAAPCGGFIILGGLVALAQWLRSRPKKGGAQT